MDAKKDQTAKRVEAGHRLLDAQALLSRATGATLQELMSELGVARRTAIRYRDGLAARGLKLEVIGDRDGSKVHRIAPESKKHVVVFTSEEVVCLKLVEGFARGFEGTGFDDAFRRLWAKTDATLKPRDRARLLDLSRKILHVPDHVHDYGDKGEVIDQLLSALLDEQRVLIKQESKTRERRRFKVDPYALVTYKWALYLVGHSHYHESVRTFAVDGIVDATRLRDEGFVYPRAFDPKTLFEGTFGIIAGEETEITVRFEESVEPWLRRRKWHATQALEKRGRFVYLTMRPRGTTEVLPWILSWGSKATVISPPSLRRAWQAHADAMARAAREVAADDERRLGDDDDDSPPSVR